MGRKNPRPAKDPIRPKAADEATRPRKSGPGSRKAKTQRLQEEIEQYRRLIDGSLQGVIVIQDFRMVFCNQAFSDICGYSRDELYALSSEQLPEIIYPEDRELVWERLKKRLAGDEVLDRYEFRGIRKDGTIRWLEIFAGRIEYNGRPAMQAAVIDITARKMAEERIRQSETRSRSLYSMFRLMADNVEDMIWAKDLEKRYIFANRAICEKLLNAVDTEEPIGKTDMFFAERERDRHPENPEWHTFGEICRDSDSEVMRTQQPGRFEESGNVGGKFLVLDVFKAPFRNEKGEIIGTVGSARDVTGEKESEREHARMVAALQSSEERFRQLIEASNDGIYLLYKRRFEIVNKKFREMFGVTLEDVNKPGFDFIQLVAPKSRELIEDRVRRSEEGEQPDLDTKYEFTALTPGGEEIEVEASVAYIKYEDGVAVQGIVRDITERKRLEAQLLQAQKLEGIGRLAGGIAHDFNNLLTSIIGYAGLMQLKTEGQRSLEHYLQHILDASERASTLVQQLLTFGRKASFKPRVINLNQVIGNFKNMLQRMLGEDISLEFVPQKTLGNVRVDPVQMEQVILNLAINSRDAMPGGGNLIIETRNAHLSETRARSYPEITPGDYAQILFSDSGGGIDKETMTHIFEPFFTTKEKGTGSGLGLSTVYGIIRQSQGHISVYSEVGKGTTFHIFLPLVDTPAEMLEPSRESRQLPRGNETILIVEDDRQVREMAVEILSECGYRVLQARSGEECLKHWPGMAADVDLLITDVVMPKMGGIELTRKLLHNRPGLPVIYMSGYSVRSISDEETLPGELDFLQKPFSPEDLAGRVRELLDRAAINGD